MTDVYFADQICYVSSTGTINRDAAVCFSLSNATKLLARSALFTYEAQLRAETAIVQAAVAAGISIADPAFPPSHYAIHLLRDRVLDNFLIGTFFEVAAKAFLLHGGYLVHKIKRKVPPTIATMQATQSTTPISAAEYSALDPFSDFKGVGRNGMKYLQFATLDYSWVYDNRYDTVLPFSTAFKDLARAYRPHRNEIHFPLLGAGESGIGIPIGGVDSVDIVRAEIDATIRPLFDSLNNAHGLGIAFGA